MVVKKFSEFIAESSLPDYEALPYNPKGTGEDFYKYVYGLFPKEWRTLEETEVGTIWVHSDITSSITKKVIVDASEGNVYHYFRKASDGTWDEFEKRDMSRDSNEPVEHGVVVTNNDIMEASGRYIGLYAPAYDRNGNLVCYPTTGKDRSGLYVMKGIHPILFSELWNDCGDELRADSNGRRGVVCLDDGHGHKWVARDCDELRRFI